MKPLLSKIQVDGVRVEGPLYGDVTGIAGNFTSTTGNVTGIAGNVTDIIGNIDTCEITDEDRANRVDIQTLIC